MEQLESPHFRGQPVGGVCFFRRGPFVLVVSKANQKEHKPIPT